MKRYVGGAPRIKEEEAAELVDNKEVVETFLSILEQCVERQESALLTAPLDNETDSWQLTVKRARLEGARALVNDAKQAITKAMRS